jgi:glycosyltransferase involved in cell wall biosynthesis
MKQPKRVLIFSLAYYPNVGGAEIAIKAITDRISPEEITFDMVTMRLNSRDPLVEQIGNVRVYRTRSLGSGRIGKFLFQFLAAIRAQRLHKKQKYNATWAMMAHSAGVPAVIFKFFHPSVPYILTLQEGDPPEHVERVMRPLWLLFARSFTRADIVQAISTFLGEWARRRGFKGALEVIPNGVDVSKFSKTIDSQELEELKQKLGKKEDDIFLITTSRVVHKNAIDDCIRALALLPQSVHFLILGIGSEEEKLKELAKSLNVSERVQFLGQVEHGELPKYLKASDIFIRPSRSEGMGNSFIEAMAAGLPVIATQEGGIADFLFDAKRNPDQAPTGWAVDKNSPQQIAEAVQDITRNPEQVARVVTTARELVSKKYDWDFITEAMKARVFETAFKKELQ